MNEAIITLIIRGSLALFCFPMAFLTLRYGNNLFQDPKSKAEKHHLKIAQLGLEYTTKSSGVLVMFLSVFWALAIVRLAPAYEENIDGTKITNADLKINPRIITAIVNSDIETLNPDDRQKLFEDVIKEAQAKTAVADVQANGKPLKYSLIAPVGTEDNAMSVSVFIPALNTTRSLKYLPVQDGKQVKFFPLDQSISAQTIKEYKNAPDRQ